MLKKRGQFFLIAAIIIVGVLTSIATVQNDVFLPKPDLTIFDLAEEIEFEGTQVIISGSLEQLEGVSGGGEVIPPSDDDDLIPTEEDPIFQDIEELTDDYIELNPNTDIIVIYKIGMNNHRGIEFTCIFREAEYEDSTDKNIPQGIGPGVVCKREKAKIDNDKINEKEDGTILEITLRNGDKEIIEVKPGQRFFFILKKVKDDQVFVLRSNDESIGDVLDGEVDDREKAQKKNAGKQLTEKVKEIISKITK